MHPIKNKIKILASDHLVGLIHLERDERLIFCAISLIFTEFSQITMKKYFAQIECVLSRLFFGRRTVPFQFSPTNEFWIRQVFKNNEVRFYSKTSS